jgi:hypothetical protein
MRLGDLAKLLRSKNAGPFMLTIDVLMPDLSAYERARSSGLLTAASISALYGVPSSEVSIFEIDEFLAIKISFPRPVPSGAEGDSDVYGCQYMARLARLSIASNGPSQVL